MCDKAVAIIQAVSISEADPAYFTGAIRMRLLLGDDGPIALTKSDFCL